MQDKSSFAISFSVIVFYTHTHYTYISIQQSLPEVPDIFLQTFTCGEAFSIVDGELALWALLLW